ncbi:MAG: DUF2281 domain-containing protein [Deltaproteobacteria bacterium]|nr:DUF2281 domain-containing protein [Deltaproteobacteria bacterium]
MYIAKKIYQDIRELSESAQAEVLDFIEFLRSKKTSRNAASNSEWSSLSLTSAMRGMEKEKSPQYNLKDLKEKF